MVRKIQVACDSRSSRDFLIIARTDARSGLGLDEALRRGEAYAKAGADILFIESPESVAEMEIIGNAVDTPHIANMANGGVTPILSNEELIRVCYSAAILPASSFLAAMVALDRTIVA